MSLDALKDRYLKAQLAGNRREALRLVIEEGARGGHSVLTLARDVIAAAQAEIGRLWEENRISIAEEHMATAISQVVMAHLYQQAEAPRPLGKKIVVGCVEGELHDFPARIVADALDLEGYEVRFLGANVPTESLVVILANERPDLLALSVTMSFNVGALRSCVERVRRAFPELPIAVGGHACTWGQHLVSELGVEGSGSDAKEMVEVAKKILGARAA